MVLPVCLCLHKGMQSQENRYRFFNRIDIPFCSYESNVTDVFVIVIYVVIYFCSDK